MATVGWNVDPSDYTQPGTGAIVARVLAQVRPGSIIISHDGGGPRGQTLAAYPRIIATLHRRGYRVVTIPDCSASGRCTSRASSFATGSACRAAQVPRNAIFQQAPLSRRARLARGSYSNSGSTHQGMISGSRR